MAFRLGRCLVPHAAIIANPMIRSSGARPSSENRNQFLINLTNLLGAPICL